MNPYEELTERAENAREQSILCERKIKPGQAHLVWDAGYMLGLAHGIEEARDFMLRAAVDDRV